MVGTIEHASDSSAWIRRGAVGGFLAGVVMAMVAMLYTLVAQGDLLAPLKQMGATFFTADAASAVSLLAGMMLHVMTAIGLGVVFALVARDRLDGAGPFVVGGMVFIAAEWAVASFLVLPAIDKPLLTTFASAGGVVAHAMYGVVLGLWLARAAR